ncbi:hypothetical protein CDAR_55791 [Caerostris darwini]|uniref:Uncharacterized protein n=1 Tax=Caerostris darwini TaxID=1538125 RepID=A0AAV4V8T5_9ARAC|nr:hypothetical protein CDAR_55791 [Caerostris darwini]
MLYESNNSSEALNIDENNSSEIFNSDNFDFKEEDSSCKNLHNEDQYCFQNSDDDIIPKKKLRYESEVEEFSSHSLLQTNDSKFKFFAPKKNEHTSAVLKGDLERSFLTESK